jgi:hypothetical protein
MPNTIYTQTAPGVNGTGGIGSNIRSPSWRHIAGWYPRGKRARSTSFPLSGPVVASPLTIQHTTQLGTGISPVFVTANTAGVDTYVNTPGIQAVVEVKNGGAQQEIVSIAAVGTCNQGYLHNYQMVVPVGGHARIGPFDTHYIGIGNIVTIGYNLTQSGVTVAVLAP